MSHARNFERWRAKLPKATRYLVEQLLERVVPVFEQRGYFRRLNYADGRIGAAQSGTIPLQRGEGKTWPTVELRFLPRGRPAFVVDAAALPAVCKQYVGPGFADIDRERAVVVEGRACFCLMRRTRGAVNVFGYQYFSLFPNARLDREVDVLLERLPYLFRAFDAAALDSYTTGQPLPEWIRLQVSREQLFRDEV